MTVEEYNILVNPEEYTLGDYGRWVSFKKSFPPLPEENKHCRLFEFISRDCSEGLFQSVYVVDDNEVFFDDLDFRREYLEYETWRSEESYWRFLPDPPGNLQYNCH